MFLHVTYSSTSDPDTMAALTSAKNALRKKMKNTLQNINLQEKREQSINVLKKVSQEKTYRSIIQYTKALEKVMF